MAGVEYRLNGMDWQTAEGTVEWSASILAQAGLNTIEVRAVDTAGNASAPVSRQFTYVQTNWLTVQINGQGSFTPDLTRQPLEVGRRYTIRARPGADSLFRHWSGSSVSSEATLSFVMTAGHVLVADFLANPFPRVAGTYNGLFSEWTRIEQNSSGAFSCRVSGNGRFTATLQTSGTRLSFSGQFGVDGTATNVITRQGVETHRVELVLGLEAGNLLSGRIISGSATASLIADLL